MRLVPIHSSVSLHNQAGEQVKQANGSFFLLPSSRASSSFCPSRKMSRSPRLAHEAPVMQAILVWSNECCSFDITIENGFFSFHTFWITKHSNKRSFTAGVTWRRGSWEREVSHLGRFKCFTLQPDSLVASNQVQYVPCSRNRSLGLLGYACCQTTSRFRGIHRARNCTKSCKRDKGQTLEGAVFGEWQIPTRIGGGRSYKERNLGRVSSNKQRFSYTETSKK